MKYHWLYNKLLQCEKKNQDLLSVQNRKCFHLKYGKHTIIIYTPQIWNVAFHLCTELLHICICVSLSGFTFFLLFRILSLFPGNLYSFESRIEKTKAFNKTRCYLKLNSLSSCPYAVSNKKMLGLFFKAFWHILRHC